MQRLARRASWSHSWTFVDGRSIGDLTEGMEVGFDVGVDSRGLRVTSMKIDWNAASHRLARLARRRRGCARCERGRGVRRWGATRTGEGVNFALFSENVTGVELCRSFTAKRILSEATRIELRQWMDEVCRCSPA